MSSQKNGSGAWTWVAAAGLTVVFLAASADLLGQAAVFPINPPPPALKTIPVPEPANLNLYVRDKAALIRMGKALYWDMQVGSDGVTACASCHFHAGADVRTKNSIDPGLFKKDTTFQTGGPNYTLTAADFPLRKLSNPEDAASPVIRDSNDIVSSMGAFNSAFLRVRLGNAAEMVRNVPDPVFKVGRRNVRRVEPRNTPTVINAVYNHHNFLDGRASFYFNGQTPFGPADPDAGIYVYVNGATTKQKLALPMSSLASQAVGPPMSDLEMSAGGRTWPDVGRKLLPLTPLAKQLVHPQDSVLGPYSRARMTGGRVGGGTGLRTTYDAMVRAAFVPTFYSSPHILRIVNGAATVIDRPARPLAANEFTQIEANFSFFFGLAVQAYEATLVSDETPYDRYRGWPGRPAEPDAISAEAKLGLDVFLTKGNCIACHAGPEFTLATVSSVTALLPEGGFPEVAVLLEGKNVLPNPVDTPALGIFSAEIAVAQKLINTSTEVAGAGEVTAIDYHYATEITMGPRMWRIYDAATDGPLPAGPLARVLTEQGLQVSAQVPDWAAAWAAIQANRTLVVVRTTTHPEGLIAGDPEVPVPGVVAPVEFMGLLGGFGFYDIGYYNIGTRPSDEDVARGGTFPSGLPLSHSGLGLLKMDHLLPLHLDPFVAELPKGRGFPDPRRIAVKGSFKTPSLRNVELTGPYFHNGGQATLRQVVEFYERGGDFRVQNAGEVSLFIRPVTLTPEESRALITFLLTLTDERVRQEQAPFDHPQLLVPNGMRGDHQTILGRGVLTRSGFLDSEEVFEVPPVGAAGRPAAGLPPIGRFLDLDPYAE